MTMHTVYLSLGTNQGDRQGNLIEAIKKIEKLIGAVVRQSAFIETEPWGFNSLNRFLNAAICVKTSLCPRCLLERTQLIERELGRIRKTPSPIVTTTAEGTHPAVARRQYADRPIDIDILLYDNLTVNEPDLIIPHPLMYERDFVMIPLREIMEK